MSIASGGNKDQVLNTGRLAYGKDENGKFYPIAIIANTAEQYGEVRVAQYEPFLFRPGNAALASGMVEAGTRSSAATVTSGTVANSTYPGSWITFAPFRSGKIDGLSSGGIVDGQITVGVKCGAGTGTAKLTLDIANTANTSAPTTMLPLTGTITCTTAEIFKTYDMPYLACDTVMNSVPFSVRLGVQTQQGGSTIIGRIMESSYIEGLF